MANSADTPGGANEASPPSVVSAPSQAVQQDHAIFYALAQVAQFVLLGAGSGRSSTTARRLDAVA
jgi:hypothetical protein